MQWRASVIDRHAATQAGGTMQGDSANMPFIEVLVNFEQIGFVIQVCAQCLTQRGEPVTGDDHYWTMDFSDDSDLEGLILSKGGSGQRGHSSQSHRSGRHSDDGMASR